MNLKNIILISVFVTWCFQISSGQNRYTLKNTQENENLSLLYNIAYLQIITMQDYGKGLESCENLINIIKNETVINHDNLVNAYNLYSIGLFKNGDKKKALQVRLIVDDICQKESVPIDIHLINLRSLGALYKIDGNFQNSLHYYSKAFELAKDRDDLRSDYYLNTISSLASIYNKLGQKEKANEYYKIFYELYKKNPEIIETKNYILSTLSYIEYRNRNFEEAIDITKQSLLFVEDYYGTEHSLYGLELMNLGNLYEANGDYENAKSCFTKAINITTKTIGTNNLERAGRLRDFARLDQKMGDTKLYYSKLKEAKNIYFDILGTNNLSYRDVTYSLSNYYLSLTNLSMAYELFLEIQDINNNIIKDNFLYLTAREKQNFMINTFGKESLNQFANYNYLTDYKNNQSVGLALNNILTSKGLVLNATKEMLSDLKGLNDPNLNQNVKQFIRQRELITKQLQLPLEKRADSLNEVREKNTDLERFLVSTYSQMFDTEIEFVKDYKNTKLNKKDIAIEFTHFQLHNKKWTDSIMYVAYIYKKEWKIPKVVNLFEEKQLKDFFEKYSSRGAIALSDSKNEKVAVSELLYELIWKPIEPYLKKVESIYYSPDGLLHKVPINALPTSEGKFLGELYDLNRVSNTAYINTENILPNLENAMLFGDIEYNYENGEKSPQDESKKYDILNSDELLKNDKNKNRNGTRNSWGYLPGTKKEIDFIKSLLPKSDVLRKKEATETAFKALSGNSPSVIHISTHGYFFPDPDTKNNESDPFKEKGYVLADDPMLRSGLIFANANYAWQNGYNPYEEDDGILTALDISNLDFRTTDIVVLSACDTGLGDIPSSEGVYGLQRAFKMAGVKSIIMTLWEVPDKETAEFIKKFYTKWKATNHPKEAFKFAQNFMMKKYRYQPDKWAAFVFLE